MMKYAAFMIVLFMSSGLYAQQDNTTDQVLEGGRIVVDLLKTFKSDGAKRSSNSRSVVDCKKARAADICFENKTAHRLEIKLQPRQDGQQDRYLVVMPGQLECAMLAPEGIYTYEVMLHSQGETIRRGDLSVKTCEDLSLRILNY